MVQLYREELEARPGTKVALLDHITSPSAIVMPVKEIVQVCHERGVRVIVDGAHAPGQLALNMAELGADYYTGRSTVLCLWRGGGCVDVGICVAQYIYVGQKSYLFYGNKLLSLIQDYHALNKRQRDKRQRVHLFYFVHRTPFYWAGLLSRWIP